ncbi:MAG TPA: multicopper oxidase domain-containing protein [Acidimicrobiales bacterium]|nr:multicopper oxidase domain-containing protein [Acidimicrobiales bacterium]
MRTITPVTDKPAPKPSKGTGGRPTPPTPSPGGGGERRDNLLVVVYALAAVALIASLVAVGLGVRAVDEADDAATPAATRRTDGAPSSVAVTLTEFAIAPAAAEIAQGGALSVTNGGAAVHNLAVEGQDLATAMIDPGGSGRLALGDLAPGVYTMFCQVPGHREAGMETTFHVVAAAAGAATTGTHAGAHSATMTADEMDAVMAKATKAFPAATEGKGAQDLKPTVLADGTKQFEVTTSVVQWEIEPGKKVEAWTYNGTVPGPTIRVDPGDKVRVVLHNELPESTVIHFHGIDVPNAMDGVPDITQPPVKPGQSYTYDFTAQATPAVAMYHSHHDAAKQVANGLAGAFLVGSEPVPAGVVVSQEQVMMLNDAGTIGFSLNGKSFPATEPLVAEQGDWVEVHYMNEGVMAHPMHLHGMAQTIIAKDGYPVAQPYKADTVLVGPGERYTVLVQATAPGTWAWHCHILPHAEREDGMFGMVTALVVT